VGRCITDASVESPVSIFRVKVQEWQVTKKESTDCNSFLLVTLLTYFSKLKKEKYFLSKRRRTSVNQRNMPGDGILWRHGCESIYLTWKKSISLIHMLLSKVMNFQIPQKNNSVKPSITMTAI
jgi:hypothetical protein